MNKLILGLAVAVLLGVSGTASAQYVVRSYGYYPGYRTAPVYSSYAAPVYSSYAAPVVTSYAAPVYSSYAVPYGYAYAPGYSYAVPVRTYGYRYYR